MSLLQLICVSCGTAALIWLGRYTAASEISQLRDELDVEKAELRDANRKLFAVLRELKNDQS